MYTKGIIEPFRGKKFTRGGKKLRLPLTRGRKKSIPPEEGLENPVPGGGVKQISGPLKISAPGLELLYFNLKYGKFHYSL